MVRRFILGLVLLLGMPLAVPQASATPGQRPPSHVQLTRYTVSNATIANPDRGFYRHTETYWADAPGSTYVALNPAELAAWRAEGTTLILRAFWLTYYGGANGPHDLSPATLAAITNDFAIARQAGMKVIVRFGYAMPKPGWPPPTPYGDAPVARTVHQIEQLAPILRANADVISVVEQGFIGLWGEGYYSDYYSDPNDPTIVTAQNWVDRAAVLKALLRALPVQITVQVRTMHVKQMIFHTTSGTAGAMTADQAFTGSDLSRVGFHNDCFLAADDDWGTFLTDPLSLDEDYLAAETRYVPMGGETCNVNPPRSEWPSASALMARYHFTFLNRSYHPDVLNSWGTPGLTATAQRLGYRLTLTSSAFPQQAKRSHRLQGSITLANTGWAAPTLKQAVHLVLIDHAGRVVRLPIAVDVRRWLPGTHHLTIDVPLTGVRPGSYRLALALPSPYASTSARPEYAIQTANLSTWNASKGWNELAVSVIVTGR